MNMKTKLSDLLKEVFNEKKIVNEASDTYFKSASEAVTYAREMAEKKGYEIDEDDWQSKIAMGGRYSRFRPSKGKTTDAIIGLLKNGKPQRKSLSISLYGMPSGKTYELTYYIN
jgi:hypothetical protein